MEQRIAGAQALIVGGRAAGELDRIRDIAHKLKLRGVIEHSDSARKRFVYYPTEAEISRYDLSSAIRFGDPTATTYFDDNSLVDKRKAFRARHSQIFLKDGRAAYKVKFTPAYMSWHLLW